MPSDSSPLLGEMSIARKATTRNLASLVSTAPQKVSSILQQTSSEANARKSKLRGSASQSFLMGSTFSFIRSKLLLFIGDTIAVDDLLAMDTTTVEILNFLKADGPRKLTFFYQPRGAEASARSTPGIAPPAPSLFLANLDSEQADMLTGKCIYFVRLGKSDVSYDHLGDEVVSGSVEYPFLESMDLLLSELCSPLLRSAAELERVPKEEREDFLSALLATCESTRDTLNGIQGGVELAPLDQAVFDDPRVASHNKLALDDDFMAYLDDLLGEWCQQVETLLSDSDPSIKNIEEEGPASELTWWKHRVANLGNVEEQLKGKDAKLVIGVANVAKCNNLKRWKAADADLTESWNEAKDHVKFLSALDKFLLPLSSGTLEQMKDILPGLFSKIRAMCAISRYYNKTPDRLLRFLRKITNQAIKNCKAELLRGGALLDQDADKLLERFTACTSVLSELNHLINLMNPTMLQGRGHSRSSRARVGPEALDSGICIFSFTERLNKVSALLRTVKQFSALFQARIEGLELIVAKLQSAVQAVRTLPYDILDHTKAAFDTDQTIFDTEISFIELSLKRFIDTSFNELHSTDLALRLFGELEAVLDREALKNELQDKYAAIFQYYGEELESVQDVYDREKVNPPVPRNVAPVTGKVLWSRHLLNRVEGPMIRFQSCKNLLGSKEDSRRIIRVYNKIAKTLIQYETMWVGAWSASIDLCKEGLHATLLVRHPDKADSLCVNFDREIIALIREGKALQRLGVEIPESAQSILAQEGKFKLYFERLSLFVQEYNALICRPTPTIKAVMAVHFEELERVVRPGMVALTWQSMNIDSYLHRINNVLQRLDTLISKIQGTISFNVDKKLKEISRMELVFFPHGKKRTLEEFVLSQEENIRMAVEQIEKDASDISYSLSQVISWMHEFSIESNEKLVIGSVFLDEFWSYYNQLFYLAILSSVKGAFNLIKSRLCSKRLGGFFLIEDPFFNVDVELSIPSVSMQPPMNAIQNAINECAYIVLSSFKSLQMLGSKKDEHQSYFYNLIVADRRIIPSILLLTGALEAVDRQVLDYLNSFKKYEFLWTENKAATYDVFLKNNPSHDSFEAELSRYLAIEREIAAIPPVNNIGCLCLRTQSLKYSLKAEAGAWKSLYAKHLHGLAKAALDDQMAYLTAGEHVINTEVVTMEEVRNTILHLKELENREAELDLQLMPIETMYYLLRKYEVRIPKEELDCLSSIHQTWKEIVAIGLEKQAKLLQFQSSFKRDLVRNIKAFSLVCNEFQFALFGQNFDFRCHTIQEVMQFCNDYEMNGPMVAGLAPLEALHRLQKYQALCEEREKKLASLREREALFDMSITVFPELKRVREELDKLDMLYSLYLRSEQTITSYYELTLTQMVSKHIAVTTNVSKFLEEMAELPNNLIDWPAYIDLKQTIEGIASIIPLLTLLLGPSIRSRHWRQVFACVGANRMIREEKMRLKQFVALNPLQYTNEIEEICKKAVKEADEEAKLKEIVEFWTDQTFILVDYKKKGLILEGKGLSDIIDRVEESLSGLSVIQKNQYSEPFLDEVSNWISKLSTVSEIVLLWSQVQSKWMHIETLFSIPDISGQLDSEARRFKKIDASYSKLLQRVCENRNVLTCCYSDQQAKNLLPHILQKLEHCETLLVKVLEGKRACFPRFYFLSDNRLLRMISEGCVTSTLDNTLNCVFNEVTSVTFEDDNDELLKSMHARKGRSEDRLDLGDPVALQREIESFLVDLWTEIGRTLRSLVQDIRSERHSSQLQRLVLNFPSQVCLLDMQIQWTKDCKDALSRAKIEKNIMVYTSKRNATLLSDLLSLLAGNNFEQISKKHESVELLVLVQIFQRDRFDSLVQDKATSPNDFDFQKLIKFSWKDDSLDIAVSIAHIELEYGFEYLGIQERIVATPQTDRCFVALACAVGAGIGSAITGPAGTGKTALIKDLGKALGRFVFVFHGSVLVEPSMIDNILKGLSSCGAWGCFEQFTNLELRVLSVCAQQITTLFAAVREKRLEFVFSDGEQIFMDSKVGLFMTRDEHDLASHFELRSIPSICNSFRTFTISEADIYAVVYVSLVSFGFKVPDAASAANKVKMLYSFCEQRLSKQAHYQFRLKNVSTVLQSLRSLTLKSSASGESIDLNASVLTVLRQVNILQLIPEDVTIFMSLLSDLFPGISSGLGSRASEIEVRVRAQAAADGLCQTAAWIDAVLELYEVCTTRQTLILCGPSCSGKSSMLATLSSALVSSGQKQQVHRIYPKAIAMSHLFGWFALETNQWHDGIFSALWRNRAMKDEESSSWISFDGPIDPVLIEGLNSILDEQTLALPNGDRISITAGMRLIFENDSLQNASPSVISRTAIYFIPGSTLTWEAVITAWLSKFKDAKQRQFYKGLVDHIPHFLNFVRDHSPSKNIQSPVNASLKFTKLYDGLSATMESRQDKPNQILEKSFVFCALWAFAGWLDSIDREKLCISLRAQLSHLCAMPLLSHGDTFFDFFVDPVTGDWEHWKSRVGEWSFPTEIQEQSFPLLLVPTVDGTRFQYLLKLVSFQKTNIFVNGAAGSAKSSLISQYIRTLDSNKVISRTISLTGVSNANLFLKRFESILEKRMGSHFGPPEGKRCVLVVEDLHQALYDRWGDSPLLELYRQLICEEGYYNSQNLREWIRVDDVQHIAVANLSVKSAKSCSRTRNKFNFFHITPMSDLTVNSVFSKILGERLSLLGARNSVVEIALTLSQSTITLWRRLQSLFQPTLERVHYTFELEDMARVFEGLVRCSADEMMFPEQVVQVWRHECERAICDKLITVEDQVLAMDAMTTTLRSQISKATSSVPLSIPDSHLCHSDVMYANIDGDIGVYKPLQDIVPIKARIQEAAMHLGMDCILFEEFVNHILRISRVLGSTRGYVLLVGCSCSGKGSLAQLAAFLSTTDTVRIQLDASQDPFSSDHAFQNAYKAAGLQARSTTLILSNPRNNGFLERVNQFVRTGHFPGLLSNEEFEEIHKEIRGKLGDNEPKGSDTVHDQFIFRARNNIRIIICLEPILFRAEWQVFPSYRKNFTIDWILPWNAEHLRGVAAAYVENYLEDVKHDSEGTATFLANLHTAIHQFEPIYQNVKICVAPRHFLSLLYTFRKLYKMRNRKLKSRATEIDLGLQKLDFAGDGVAIMKAELEDKDSVLKFSQETTSSLLKDISLSTMKTEKKKAEVMAAKNIVAEHAAQLQQCKDEYEQDVAYAGPALREAEQAITSISMKELATLKLIKNPPLTVKLVFDCVLVFFRKPIRNFEPEGNSIRDSYHEGWKLLQDPLFVKNLSGFSSGYVNDETVELIAPYLEQKDFAFEKIGTTSLVARSLFLWIRALSHHHELTRAFIPKMKAVQSAESKLALANRNLENHVAELNLCQQELDELQSRFENAIAEKHRLNNHASKVESKISSAESLLHSLELESARWKDERLRLKECLKAIVGDCGIASAYLVYLGQFHSDFRFKVYQAICATNQNTASHFSSAYNFLSFFFSSKNSSYISDNDHVHGTYGSNENEIIIMNSPYPVALIDPYEQGALWITSKESVTTYALSSDTDQNLRHVIEECVATGKSLLIKDMDYELHPDVGSLLKGIFRIEGKPTKAMVFGKELDVAHSFCLYISFRVFNPNLEQEYFARSTIVDCSISVLGMELQLLTILMEKEKPELHRSRALNMLEVSSNEARLADLDQVLLKSLSQTEGYLLEDQSVINSLISIKSAAQDADDNLQKARNTEARINETYEAYRPVASMGRLLFGVLEELRVYDRMYYFTLSEFLLIFAHAIEVSDKSPSAATRVLFLIQNIKTVIIKHYLRQLFHEHMPVFGLLSSFRILCDQDKLTSSHLTYLIHPSGRNAVSNMPSKAKEWITDSSWMNCVHLSDNFTVFNSLLESVSKKETWRSWLEREAPELEPLPDFNHLDIFHKVMLFRALREDRMMAVLQVLNTEVLGEVFSQQRNVFSDIEELSVEGTSGMPLIIVFRLGFDPAPLILNVAKRKHITVEAVSLAKAHKNMITGLISKSEVNGSWVVLQNAHLALDSLNDIERSLSKAENTAKFRLWVTTAPAEAFPISFLRVSAKVMVQPPVGIKNTMHMLAFDSLSEEIIGSSDAQRWFKTFYTVCYTYCIIHERIKYGPVGFSLPYDFDISDWSITVSYLRDHVVDQDGKEEDVSSALLFIIGEIVFGGRVESDWDRRIINACIEIFFANDIQERQLEFLPQLQLPESNNSSAFMDTVLLMPLTDNAEKFGLCTGADFVVKAEHTQQFLLRFAMLSLGDNYSKSPQIPTQTLQKRDELVLSKIHDALSKLELLRNLLKTSTVQESQKQDKVAGRRRMSTVESIPTNANRIKFQVSLGSQKSVASQPLLSFLYNEATLVQQVISLAISDLKDLITWLSANSHTPSDSLAQVYNSLADSEVPSTWAHASWPASNLSAWIASLQQRHEQLDRWIAAGKLKSYWIGGFNNPHGFILALRLEISKKRGWIMEHVVLVTEISAKENEAYSHDGVILQGNFIEGATWSYREGRLADNSKRELINDFPKILLYFNSPTIPIPESSLPSVVYPLQPWESRKEGYYFCPVYSKRNRSTSSFLWAMPLRCEEQVLKWVLRGVAILCCKD